MNREMERLQIANITEANVDDAIGLCLPSERKANSVFMEGAGLKKKWASIAVKEYGSIGKLAYLGSKPVGLIQYLPNAAKKLVEISCIFVPDKQNLRTGVGRSMLKALVEDMKKPKPYFANDVPSALVARTFDVPGLYPQHEFFAKMGFRRAKEDDPHLLFYPTKEKFVYVPRNERYLPQPEDAGKVVIFYDPSCPFCMHFSRGIEEAVREIVPEVPIRMISQLEDPDEIRKRGKVHFCVVNGKPIVSFFLDRKSFQREVSEALKD